MSDRSSKYESLTNPKTAADYAVSMPAEDFLAEAAVRGEVHPWLQPQEELDGTSIMQMEARRLGEACARLNDEIIQVILK